MDNKEYPAELTQQLTGDAPANPTNDLSELLPLLQQLKWAKHDVRRQWQEHSVDIVPVSFYSSTPSIAEIESSFEYQSDSSSTPPYLMPQIFDHALMAQYLTELGEYAHEFAPEADGDEQTCTRYFWKNSQFSHSDAMSYYCFLRKLKPRTVVEIGSGFSTLVASEAVTQNGVGRITCVEPYPRPFLPNIPHVTVQATKAQDVTVEWLHEQLQDDDVLFIDSTHTVKSGSDCLHIYLRLIPQLKRRLYIHVHDIFLPHGLPQQWLLDLQIFWTEQYLLLALLLDNPKAKVLYGSAYHESQNAEALKAFMHGRWSSGGGSFWFLYDGRA
jgi:cephalosporin hydroxylase